MEILGPALQIELDGVESCPAEALALVPREWAEQHACVPFELTTDGNLCLAAGNPSAIATFQLVPLGANFARRLRIEHKVEPTGFEEVKAELRDSIGLSVTDRKVEFFFADEAAISRAIQRFYG